MDSVIRDFIVHVALMMGAAALVVSLGANAHDATQKAEAQAASNPTNSKVVIGN